MVLDDVFSSSSQGIPAVEKPIGLESRLASPMDRLAAFVADVIVFSPVATLIASPLSQRAREARVTGQDDEWMTLVFSISGLVVISWLAYQVLFLVFFSATPGKMALRLKVVSLWNLNRPRPIEIFLRCLTWNFEILFCGLPWLAVFSNEKRRPFHDRIADSAVISLKRERWAGPATFAEISFASGFQSAGLAIFTMMLFVHASEFRRARFTNSGLAAAREDDGRLCPEVREVIDQSAGRKRGSIKDRLEVAMTLSASQTIESECLDREADFALWRNQELELAYLAKALRAEGTTEERLAYLQKVCPENRVKSEICVFKNFLQSSRTSGFGAGDKEAETEAESKLSSLLEIASTSKGSYISAYLVRYLMDSRRYTEAVALMDAVSEPTGGFLARERAKALWHIGNRNEASAALKTGLDLLPIESRLLTAQWFCREALGEYGCRADAKGYCDSISSAVEKNENWLVKADVAIAYARAKECDSKFDQDEITRLQTQMPTKEGRLYLEALHESKFGDRARALSIFSAMANVEPGASISSFQYESMSRMVDLASSESELNQVLTSWMKMDSQPEGWRRLGQGLIDRALKLKSSELALRVGLKLTQEDPTDLRTLNLMVGAARSAGQTAMARYYSERISALGVSSGSGGRLPASEERQ